MVDCFTQLFLKIGRFYRKKNHHLFVTEVCVAVITYVNSLENQLLMEVMIGMSLC